MLIHMYLYPFIFHIDATASLQRDLFFSLKNRTDFTCYIIKGFLYQK